MVQKEFWQGRDANGFKQKKLKLTDEDCLQHK